MPDGNVIQIRVQGRVVDPSGRGQAGVAVGVAAERTSGDEAAGVVLESAVTDEHGVFGLTVPSVAESDQSDAMSRLDVVVWSACARAPDGTPREAARVTLPPASLTATRSVTLCVQPSDVHAPVERRRADEDDKRAEEVRRRMADDAARRQKARHERTELENSIRNWLPPSAVRARQAPQQQGSPRIDHAERWSRLVARGGRPARRRGPGRRDARHVAGVCLTPALPVAP
jgi:hypothetical protein